MLNRRSLSTLALLSVLFACGGTPRTTKVRYAVSAKKNLEIGEKKLKDKDWLAASKYFSFVKARFPFSRQAVTAELRLADSEFGAEAYLQAIDSYKNFIKFHPTHEKVTDGYVAFKIGESYIKLLPGDLWIIPPSFEKDQSATTDAHRELSKFEKKYPSSQYLPKAKKYLLQINTRLANHEYYVAQFYWERDKPSGTILRLRQLLKKNKGTALDKKALDLLGRAYKRVGDKKRAKMTMEQLIKEFPSSSEASEAKKSLSGLKANGPA